MVETEQRQHRRVQIVNVNLVGGRCGAEFIRCAIDRAAFHPAAGEEGGERLGVVVAARIVVAISVLDRLASELAAPDDERIVEKISLFQIRDERGERLINFLRALRQAILDVLMMIPAAGPDLHEAHPALDQPARNEQLIALAGTPVSIPYGCRFFLDVERIRRLGLHLERHFVRLQARFELRVLLEILRV